MAASRRYTWTRFSIRGKWENGDRLLYRLDFLARLEAVCAKGGAFVYAWCLMDNHFHLALRTGRRSLSTIMRKLLTGYASGFKVENGDIVLFLIGGDCSR